ncbi:MAG: FG-GAP-like repeat-containing protein [Bacteroidetes bacterium]|nr:FG-GAP-like repeat-containing protein [Bacteroidota bacterium]
MKLLLSTLTFSLIAAFGIAQAPSVQSVSPSSQSLVANPNNPIIISFDQSLNPATVTQDNVMVFGRWSGPMAGSIDLDTSNSTLTFTPQSNFFYGEWVTVRLTSGVENTSGDALTNGYAFNFWIKTLPGTLEQSLVSQFSAEQTGETFIQCYGAYAGDINDDDYSDLVVITEAAEDIRVFLNDGEGGYSDFTVFDMPESSNPSTNEGADFNRDGKIDIAIGSIQNDNVSVFMGDDTAIFNPEIGYNADNGIRGITVLDVNGDGWDDIATANRSSSTYSILINDGTGSFNAPITSDAGISNETSIAAVDLNNDGIQDLAIGGFGSNNVVTMLNDGQGNFTSTNTTTISGSPWMLTAGDVNGDGNVDIISVNSSSGDVSILLGDGAGNLSLFNEYPVGNFSLAIDVGDIDGDGDLDFISSNFGSNDFTLYENNGNGVFSNPITYDAVQAGSCAILHDRNNDGALDITLIDEIEDVIILYENTPTLGVDTRAKLADDIIVYPNPFQSEFYINGLWDGPAIAQIFDMQGRVLHTYNFIAIANQPNLIDMQDVNIADGYYILEVSDGNEWLGRGKRKRRKIIRKKQKK